MFFIKNLLLESVQIFLNTLKYSYVHIFDIISKRSASVLVLQSYKNQQNKKTSGNFITIKDYFSNEMQNTLFYKLKFFLKLVLFFTFFKSLNWKIFKDQKFHFVLTIFASLHHLAHENHYIKRINYGMD